MKKILNAKVIIKDGPLDPNGQTKIMSLRSGKKGTGKIINSVQYWPWEDASKDEAVKTIYLIANRNNIDNVIWPIQDY